jgi:hypothetical protein
MRTRSPRHLTVLLALAPVVICLACPTLPAQIMAPPPGGGRNTQNAANVPTTTIHVNGVVVSSLDGKPVSRVLVTSTDRRFAALTDWQGRFAFDFRMPTGSSQFGATSTFLPALGLLLRKPGYTTNNNQASRVPTPSAGSNIATVQLRITPMCVIVGHATPDSGDLPNSLHVTLRRRQALDGIGQWIQAGSAQVDRNGDFRFADLTPGDYIVMSSSWTQPVGFGVQNRPDTARGLLPTYYPGGATLAEATPVHVRPGETADITLRPSSATFYRVSVSVGGLSTPNFGATLLSDAGFSLGANGATHTIEGYLPSGSYTLRIQSFDPIGRPGGPSGPAAVTRRTTSSFAHLQVGSAPLIGGTITAAPAADIQVNVTRNFTSTQQQPQPNIQFNAGGTGRPAPPVYIDLQRVDDNNTFSNSEQDIEGDTVTLHNIPEGTYHVHINAPQGYVASAISGATNLLATPLTVGGGGSAAPIYVTLRDDYATLSCRIKTNEQPDAIGQQTPVFVVAIPLDTPELRVVSVGFSSQPLSTSTSVVPPGRYLVVAGPPGRIQTLEYRNPEILHDLMSKGAIVTLAPGAKESVDIPLMPDGDD